MAMLRNICDFAFGVLLIGGAPLSILALTIIFGDLFQNLFHVVVPETGEFIATTVMFVVSVVAFISAIRFRLRKRLLPQGIIVVETVIGVAGAFLFFSFYGVVMHYIID